MNKWFMASLVPFMGGMVVAVNLSLLLGYNHDYQAEWWKVFVCLGASLASSLFAAMKEKP